MNRRQLIGALGLGGVFAFLPRVAIAQGGYPPLLDDSWVKDCRWGWTVTQHGHTFRLKRYMAKESSEDLIVMDRLHLTKFYERHEPMVEVLANEAFNEGRVFIALNSYLRQLGPGGSGGVIRDLSVLRIKAYARPLFGQERGNRRDAIQRARELYWSDAQPVLAAAPWSR